MTIWIDPPAWPAHGRLWSHLVSDLSYAELHDFADAQGVSRRAFEGDHYDVPDDVYARLVAAGAQQVGAHDLVRILRRSGLRIQKRTRERVVESLSGPTWLPPGSRVDVIASRQATPPVGTVVVRLATVVGGQVLLGAASDGGLDLPSASVERDDVLGAVAGLRGSLDGEPGQAASLLGYVRYTVPDPDAGYLWPSPVASFAVYLSRTASPALTGQWVPVAGAGALVGERDWWPLLAPLDGST